MRNSVRYIKPVQRGIWITNTYIDNQEWWNEFVKEYPHDKHQITSPLNKICMHFYGQKNLHCHVFYIL